MKPGLMHRGLIARRLMLRIGRTLLIAAGLFSAAPEFRAAAQGPPPAQAPATEPKGQLTLGLYSLGTSEQWLPWLESGREGWLTLEPIYESLVSVAVKGELEPQLAERWEVDPTGQRWRFFLRKGIKFHDGVTEFTAEDVKFSFEQYISDKSVASSKPVLAAAVERIEITGPHDLTFHLKKPDAIFLVRMAQTSFGVVSKSYLERVGDKEAAAKPIGTGPYKLVEHRRQQFARFEAVAPHWRETGRFKTVLLRRVPDQAARVAMLRAGEIDVTDVPFRLKREVEAAGLKLFRIEEAVVYYVQLGGQLLPTRETLDTTVPWVGDPKDPASLERAAKVRLALNLAVDKATIIKSIFEGEGRLAAVPYLITGGPYVPDDLKPTAYDPKEAKRLLVEAGYPSGFSREIEVLLMPFPGRLEMNDVGEAVAGYWERNLGLKAKRRPMDYATYAATIGLKRQTAWLIWTHGATPRLVSEPIYGMDTWAFSTSRFNTVMESPALDALAAKARTAVDPKLRGEAYREMARLFHAGHHAVPIAVVPQLYAYNPKKIAAWPLPPGEAYIAGYERAVPMK